jgi:RNA polymerase sigma-70 factor (ECF subfamily)
MVLRRCRWMLRDEAWAKDAMQDVFVQLLRRETLVVEHPSSLLHRIATNVCLNLLRAKMRHPEDSDDELLLRIATSEDHGGQIEAKSVLDRIFGREKESTRTIAVMHLLDGYTLEEVARETGLSVSGIRKRLRTLRGRVRELEALG